MSEFIPHIAMNLLRVRADDEPFDFFLDDSHDVFVGEEGRLGALDVEVNDIDMGVVGGPVQEHCGRRETADELVVDLVLLHDLSQPVAVDTSFLDEQDVVRDEVVLPDVAQIRGSAGAPGAPAGAQLCEDKRAVGAQHAVVHGDLLEVLLVDERERGYHAWHSASQRGVMQPARVPPGGVGPEVGVAAPVGVAEILAVEPERDAKVVDLGQKVRLELECVLRDQTEDGMMRVELGFQEVHRCRRVAARVVASRDDVRKETMFSRACVGGEDDKQNEGD